MNFIDKIKSIRFTTWLFTAVMAIFLTIRFIEIDKRAIHHDESLHAIYGKYFHDSPKQGFYKYDPMLHGPLLYHVLPYAYHIGGQSLKVGRTTMVFIGIVALLILIPLVRVLGSFPVLSLLLFLTTSPSMIYWSRFLREDMLVLISYSLILFGMFFYKGRQLGVKTNLSFAALISFSIGVGFIFCIKESYFISIFLVLFYILYEYFAVKYYKVNTSSFLTEFKQSWKTNLPDIILCLSLISFIVTYFYTAGFQYKQGIIDFLTLKGFFYWAGQHHTERITGPFIYYFLMLFWHEPLFTLFFVLFVFQFLRLISFKEKMIFIFSIMALFILYLIGKNFPSIFQFTGKFLKLKTWSDFIFFPFLLGLGFFGTNYLLREGKRLLAASYFWFTANYFTYSYAGEKVPWLLLYPLVNGLFFFSFWFSTQWNNFKLWPRWSKILGVITLTVVFLFQSYLVWVINFKHPGSKTEIFSQVHTTKKYEQLLIDTNNLIENKQYSPHILVLNDLTWPTTWYLYGLPQFSFILNEQLIESYDIILTTTYDLRFKNHGYEFFHIPFRHWWVPDYESLNLKNLFQYLILRKPWNETGTMFGTVFYKPQAKEFINFEKYKGEDWAE